MSKGQLFAITFLFIIFFVLNQKSTEVFFKIKRQRLYKVGNFDKISSKIDKTSGLNIAKKKRRLRENKLKSQSDVSKEV